MPSKSQSSASKVFRALAWAIVAAALPEAHATLSVSLTGLPNVPVDFVGGGILTPSTVNATSIYYLASQNGVVTPVSATSFVDTGFKLFDVTQNAASASEVSGGRANMIKFTVSSTAVVGGQTLALIVQTNQSANTAVTMPMPIANVNGVDCTWTGSGFPSPCLGTVASTIQTHNHSFAAAYTGQPLTVGIYPQDVCNDFNTKNSGVTAQGCNTSTLTAVQLPEVQAAPAVPVVTKLLPMVFDFKILAVDANGNTTGSTLDELSFQVGFQSTPPTANCNLSDPTLYFPGDGEIFLNTGFFSLGTTSFASGQAPRTHIIVAANVGSGPVLDSTYAAPASNSLLVTAPTGSAKQEVPGFTNVTAEGADHQYGLGFLIRDAAGIAVTDPVACDLFAFTGRSVETSAIQGFLAKSSCFIASAAFEDPEAEPVRWLRAFRDLALMRSKAGRTFVHWYYHWSPPAAAWVLEHPMWRLPILWGLIPLEAGAWSVNHLLGPWVETTR